jgi:hypothetical protein
MRWVLYLWLSAFLSFTREERGDVGDSKSWRTFYRFVFPACMLRAVPRNLLGFLESLSASICSVRESLEEGRMRFFRETRHLLYSLLSSIYITWQIEEWVYISHTSNTPASLVSCTLSGLALLLAFFWLEHEGGRKIPFFFMSLPLPNET